LRTLSEVTAINGQAGRFQVELLRQPRYIDMTKCIACGTCAEKCPKKIVDTYNVGLAQRKAVYVEYAQAVPLKYVIDPAACIYLQKGKCGACKKFCPVDAVDFEQKPFDETLEVGAVIMAPGYAPFDPSRFDNYQYANFANVISSLEMERILSATGPFQGHLIRPSDKQHPHKIAWLQCVGSRDVNRCDHGYCSSVCCMYAIKQTIIAKEHSPQGLDAAVFFMDIRTYGKDFEKYYNRAKDGQGVRFIPSKVHSITEDRDTRDLTLRYVDHEGRLCEEVFNMVVLSVGMETPAGVVDLAKRLDVAMDADRFAVTTDFAPVATSRPGIYVCGAFNEPKDIPYSVMEASAAACEAQVALTGGRNTLVKQLTYPPEKPVAGEPPRIGVFVCHCGINIGGIVNVPEVAAYARTLPDVAYVEDALFTCSQDVQEKMKAIIAEHRLNRIVVAACTPRTHEPLFQETLKSAGLNKYLFEMANIRNQCSWVHSQLPADATVKAKDLVAMSVARARLIQPLEQPTIGVERKALVIGGGIAGMTAALGLADQGFATYLVEKQARLGCNARHLLATWRGEAIGPQVDSLAKQVEAHPLIDVFVDAQVKEAAGFVGNFETTIVQNGKDSVLKHGAVVMAVGAAEHRPEEYLYGQDPRVMTHLDLDAALAAGDNTVKDAQNAVFIQCVGSREPQRPYCSKVCCTHSVKSALKLKKAKPDMQVYVLYRDIRTYGQRESLYKDARAAGVIFMRYALEEKPRVSKGDLALAVRVSDHILQRQVEIDADLVVLASAIVPPADIQRLAQMYKLSVNEDGFFMEAHAKLRPVEFATDGVFMAGLAHCPKPVEESIAQAKAAASRAAVVLSKAAIMVEGVVSHINETFCRGCGDCTRVCPYNAVVLETRQGQDGTTTTVANVRAALCKGCGACAVACPTGAAAIFHFDDEEVLTMVETALAN